jgi:hypothetical protein
MSFPGPFLIRSWPFLGRVNHPMDAMTQQDTYKQLDTEQSMKRLKILVKSAVVSIQVCQQGRSKPDEEKRHRDNHRICALHLANLNEA